MRGELADQRTQLRDLDERLARMEAAIDRLAAAGEQVAAMQEPFVRLAAAVTGQSTTRSRADDRPGATDPPSTSRKDQP